MTTDSNATGKRRKRPEVPLTERAAYSLAEFAALMGKERTWAYRLAQAGKIATIPGLGIKLIPRSEVERLQSIAAPVK